LIRPLRSEETGAFARLGNYAFDGRSVEQRIEDFSRRVRPERNCLVGEEDGFIVSQLMIYELAYWIEGARYPTGGLANVATVPERARRGYASRLLRASLAWMRDELGHCLSTLFPTVQPLYAGLGWALAESGAHFVAPAGSFRPAASVPSDPGGQVERRPARLDDVELLEPIYRRFAAPRSGYLDRPRWYWESYYLRPQRTTAPTWLGLWRGSDGELAGYVQYSQRETPEPHIRVNELVAIRPEAYRGLLEFLAAHHLWDKIRFTGGGDVPWLHLIANPHEIHATVDSGEHVLVRVVDVPSAIRLRHMPSGDAGRRLRLRVRDHAAPWNDRVWQIGSNPTENTAGWVCEPVDGEHVDADLDIAAFSSLFFGFMSTRQALDVGALQASDEARPTLDALFHTSYPPHSGDHF
jgi:predicted acetyltransferase